jgi:hypothetical protein
VTKFDKDIILQNITTASMLLAAAPTVGASSPNNIKDDALGYRLGAGAYALPAAILGAGAAATAWRFVRVAVHMMQYLPPLLGAKHAPHSHLKAGEEEAMLGCCGVVVVCGCLFHVV